MQAFITFLIIYFFGLGSIIMTWYVVRAFIKFLRTKQKEEQQKGT